MLHYEVVAGNPSHISHYAIGLHGLGDSLAGWKPVAQELPVPGLAWVFVNAPFPYFEGFSWFRIPGMTGLDHRPEDMACDIEASRTALSALLSHLAHKWDVSYRQFVLMGFSQGCYMVLDQALRSAEAFAGVVGISGGLPVADEYPAALGAAAHSQRILLTHGLADEVVPIAAAEHAEACLTAWDIPVDYRTYDKAHSLDPVQELPDLHAFLGRCVND